MSSHHQSRLRWPAMLFHNIGGIVGADGAETMSSRAITGWESLEFVYFFYDKPNRMQHSSMFVHSYIDWNSITVPFVWKIHKRTPDTYASTYHNAAMDFMRSQHSSDTMKTKFDSGLIVWAYSVWLITCYEVLPNRFMYLNKWLKPVYDDNHSDSMTYAIFTLANVHWIHFIIIGFVLLVLHIDPKIVLLLYCTICINRLVDGCSFAADIIFFVSFETLKIKLCAIRYRTKATAICGVAFNFSRCRFFFDFQCCRETACA